MRLLHTSDWHLGRSLESVSLVDQQRAFIDWLAATVSEHEVDAVLVAGDVFDRSIPSVDAVGLLDHALASIMPLCPIVIIPGNHDSADRLGYGGAAFAAAGVHLRARIADIDRPVVLTDGTEVVLVYGVPYLNPDVVRSALDADRSHVAVLTAAMNRVRADLAERRASAAADGDPAPRAVVMAHAFITGGQSSESERDVSVGGVADAPASVFDGVDYVALGHLHGPQEVSSAGGTTVHYSGTPLAYSFSEQSHVKSVTVIDLSPAGAVTVELLPTPVPRPLRKLTGDLADLLQDPALATYEDHWVWACLTDPRRPENAMDQVRTRFPHAIQLTWDPHVDGALASTRTGRVDPSTATPIDVLVSFIETVTQTEVTEAERALSQESIERVTASGA